MVDSTNTTEVDKQYLTNFRTYIQGLISVLKVQVMTGGTSYIKEGSGFRPALDGNLKVSAGSQNFPAAVILGNKLAAVGRSVATQLAWLEKLLSDMDVELGHTITGFTDNESFNTDTVDTFVRDFPTTINDLKPPAPPNSNEPPK